MPGTDNSPSIWFRALEARSCFATAFRLDKALDFTRFAKSLPEGVVLCDPRLIAGVEHVEAVLLQTAEYWKRNERLVRNGSIEILMRLSCRGQIEEAIKASGIQNTDRVALLGLVSSLEEAEKLVQQFILEYEPSASEVSLLELNRTKAMNLKPLHSLPSSLSDRDLQIALQERSVLLIFSK
jgi:tRNA threonylcarbamoyladenosine modification (KEOPS) complex Cgi121 subunit